MSLKYVKKLGVGLYRRFIAVLKLITTKEYINSESYYSPSKKKSRFAIFLEQLLYCLKFGEINEFYYTFGFDVMSSIEKKRYISYVDFIDKRNLANRYASNTNYLVLLRDKFVFGQLLKSLGFQTPTNIGLISKNQFTHLESNTLHSLDALLDLEGDFFVKIINGECGNSVFPITVKSGIILIKNKESRIDDLKSILTDNGLYLLQKSIKQHSVLSNLYPKSINTLRITTILNPKTFFPEFFSGTLRIGANGSFVDNWATGGLIVNVNIDGHLDRWGYFKPGIGTRTSTHPDTDVVFDGYVIPNYSNLIKTAIQLHSYLYGIHSIGWDISIDKNGNPVFIEGNDNWEITLPQVTIGGMKEKFESYLK